MKKPSSVIDLFAGVGGLSLGVARAGFTLAAAVELDKIALAQHSENFPNVRHVPQDISSLTGEELLRSSSVKPGELAGLVGGPPCQGFSEIGLRGADDARNHLFVDFFRLVAETLPTFFLAENVPGVVHSRNRGLLDRALSFVPSHYSVLEPMVVRASEYGAPTTRTRVFFYGYDPLRINVLEKRHFAPKSNEDVKVSRALAGLPEVRTEWQSDDAGWQVIDKQGEGHFESRIAGEVPLGVGHPEALRRYERDLRVSGFIGTKHTTSTIERFSQLQPGASDPISKAPRLRMDGYCPTIRAGTGPERGSYQAVRPVHPLEPRVITPREAARLQGFPDWFQFHPTKWHAFRQIGNSVSPIVAESLMRTIAGAL